MEDIETLIRTTASTNGFIPARIPLSPHPHLVVPLIPQDPPDAVPAGIVQFNLGRGAIPSTSSSNNDQPPNAVPNRPPDDGTATGIAALDGDFPAGSATDEIERGGLV